MRVGILGAGDISRNFLNAAGICEVEVAAIYNHHIEKAQALADEYNVERVYDDYQAFLEDDSFDTVYIGLPNGLHCEYAGKAMAYGKNVLIEKPFCSNMSEFKNLVELARENKVFLIEMDRVQALPNFKVMQEKLPYIGEVSAVIMNYSQYSRKFDAYLEGSVSNVFTTEFSGGALMDLGVYGVNLAIALFGMPKNLNYTVKKLETGVDVSGVLTLHYDTFVVAIICSKDSVGHKHVAVQGEKGTLISYEAPSVLNRMFWLDRYGQAEVSASQDYDASVYTLWEMKRIIEEKDYDAYYARLNQSKRVMKVLDTARKSAGIVFDNDLEI